MVQCNLGACSRKAIELQNRDEEYILRWRWRTVWSRRACFTVLCWGRRWLARRSRGEWHLAYHFWDLDVGCHFRGCTKCLPHQIPGMLWGWHTLQGPYGEFFPFPINLLIELLLSFPDRTLGSRHRQLLWSPKDPHRTTPAQDQRRHGRRATHHNMGITHRNILSRSQLGEAFTVRPPSCCQMHRRAVPCSNLQTLGARLPELV